MTDDILLKKSQDYLRILCSDIKERCVGSDGNRQATSRFEEELSSNGWKTEMPEFDGEDYYAVPGQMNYIEANGNSLSNILLNINIDGAGYREGPSSFSLFDLPPEILSHTRNVIGHFEGLTEGAQWVQGDHSIFIQYGVPAIAVSSGWFIDNMADQDVTHTPKDNIGIVDCTKIVEIARALNNLIRLI